MAASDGGAGTGRDGDQDSEGAGEDDGAAWVARVVDALGPLDDRDREVLGRLLNRRTP
ncbi:hypothetical protein ACQEU6_45195 [Spirillospora sp. CA-108201]